MLQQHFRNMEALALDLMEPEQAVDLTCKEAMMELRSSFMGVFLSTFTLNQWYGVIS